MSVFREKWTGQILLKDLLQENEQLARIIYFDEVTGHFPKDPNLQIQVYTGELRPGGKTPWHAHNGTALFLVTHGNCQVERRDTGEIFEYGPGDVFFEPVGHVHRGINPTRSVYTCFGLKVTPPGLDHDTYMPHLDKVPNRSFREDPS